MFDDQKKIGIMLCGMGALFVVLLVLFVRNGIIGMLENGWARLTRKGDRP